MNVMYENIPIFARIAEGIKDSILSGEIKEGEQLPSTTRISKEYNINTSLFYLRRDPLEKGQTDTYK